MTSPMKRGASIRIFLVDGTPHGLRVVERAGWTGSCLAFARADYSQARSRVEAGRTGVYVLVGPDASGHRAQRAYVGEADEVRVRLDAHQKEKDFWTSGLIMTSTNDSLNKAHVRYLEARLLAVARSVDLASLDNSTAPPLPHLSEAEVADMESYLDNALVLLPLVGVNLFEAPAAKQPATATTPTRSSPPTAPTSTTSATYFLKSPGVAAEAEDDALGFIVRGGALGNATTGALDRGYAQLRASLQTQGLLVPHGKDQVRLTKDYTFEAPSAAASVLVGGNRNGRLAWKDSSGRTLRENQEQSTTTR